MQAVPPNFERKMQDPVDISGKSRFLHSMDSENQKGQDGCSVALVPTYGAGDGLVILMMAQALRENHYRVTLYSDFMFQLKDWVPGIEVHPFPDPSAAEEVLSGYDLVIAHPKSVLTAGQPAGKYADLARKYLFMSMVPISKKHQPLVSDHRDRLKGEALKRLAPCVGYAGESSPRTLPVVDRLFLFCQNELALQNVRKANGLTPPGKLEYRKHDRRILIHPTSSQHYKNWTPAKFLELARRLAGDGYEVVFTVSPPERPEWLELAEGSFPVPLFRTLGDLAGFTYESGALIGTDSGNGHLASSLGLPVLTIFNKRRKGYQWRPRFGPGKVVCPWFTFRWRGTRRWKPFLPVGRVLSAFHTLIESSGSEKD